MLDHMAADTVRDLPPLPSVDVLQQGFHSPTPPLQHLPVHLQVHGHLAHPPAPVEAGQS